ncbi:hypothetical protein BXZ70DRAFT_1011243 [Cristinia sonorae]|uniref:Uncharacterized protein n=1 Tax=Cristinia sonorae TaxID=1940300 RepID=A0A8K0UGB7_9AGAR|nr:hypothetical protein BXZ70DRAFT_1012057 [Cristinia sonorae]KAH8091439.1 hypothetical protein BXZ70DRAFT_1011243 [Cristinia sonorae]
MTNREFNNKFSTFMMNTFLATLKYRTGRGADLDKIVSDRSFDMGSPELRTEAEGIVGQMVAAFLNPVRLNWDLDHVRERLTPGADGLNEGKEANLASIVMFTVYSGVGHAKSVLPLRQMAVYQADAHIAAYFTSPSDSGSWRNNSRYFARNVTVLPNGCLNMSPAWYEMGKEQLSLTSPVFKHPDSGIDNWIGELRDFHALCTGVLRIMHPHLYRASQQLFQKLAAEMSRFYGSWGLPFTAVSIISNRWSPFHRDTKASPSMYDMLVTVAKQNAHCCVYPIWGWWFGMGREALWDYWPIDSPWGERRHRREFATPTTSARQCSTAIW